MLWTFCFYVNFEDRLLFNNQTPHFTVKRILTLFLALLLGMLLWTSLFQVKEDASLSPLKNQEDHTIEKIQAHSGVLWPLKPSIPREVIIPTYSTYKSAPNLRNYKVKYGDSFHLILNSLLLPVDQVRHLAYEISKTIDLNQFQVGNTYRIKHDEHTTLPVKLIYDLEDRQELHVDFNTSEVTIQNKMVDITTVTLDATITSSLAQTVIKQGAPEELADKILSVFAWKIDFRHLQKGDHFKVIFEKESSNGEVLGVRNILAIHFTHEDSEYRAYGFDNGNGHELFDEGGHNMSYAPLQFEMITSLYAQKRFHPTQRRYKAHYGMDFEADLGTPVEAIQDGVITRAKFGRANGNNVKIKHGNDLSTQYLHLSKIDSSIHIGDRVKQGQVIGYVGNTGWSSGPHLCLRVWYKGKQRDPLDFDFPRRSDITSSNMPEFLQHMRRIDNQLTEVL